MILVDTSVWIDYLAGTATRETDWLESNMDASRIGLPDLVAHEILQGLPDENIARAMWRDLRKFREIQCGGSLNVIESARNYRKLRGLGHTVRGSVDCLVATACIRGRHRLLHRDRDYEPFEKHLGLDVIHP